MYLAQFDEPGGHRNVVIDDDGRTCYAYLRKDDAIVSSTWLYNRAVIEPGWEPDADVECAPLNRPELIADESFEITDDTEIRCEWDVLGVDVYVDNRYMARLEAKSPGWSRLARVVSPFARPLSEFLK